MACVCMMVLIHQHWFITWTLAHIKYEEFSIFYPLWHASLTLMGIFPFHRSGSGQRKCLFIFLYYEQFLMFGCNSLSFLQLSSTHQHLRHLDFESSFFIRQLEENKIYSHSPNQEELEKPIEFRQLSHIHMHMCEHICYTKCFLSVYMCLLMHSFIYLVWLSAMLLLKKLFYSPQTGFPRLTIR